MAWYDESRQAPVSPCIAVSHTVRSSLGGRPNDCERRLFLSAVEFCLPSVVYPSYQIQARTGFRVYLSINVYPFDVV